MARYDRIAPLPAPLRENAFPAWLALRDIDGSDRDNEVSRRARLRFLSIRPIARLLDRGIAGVSRESYLAQIEAVREELGYLPARDVERVRLARFLHQVEARDPARIIAATLEMADACAVAGHTYAAEEYALTALGLAKANGEVRLEGCAHLALSRVYRMRGQLDDAATCGEKAAALSERGGSRIDLVNARGEQALLAALKGDHAGAGTLLDRTLREVRAASDTTAEGIVAARYVACMLVLKEPAAALEHGSVALRHLEDVRERAMLLELIGTAFAMIGLYKAAERCFAQIAQRGMDPPLRARARAAHALTAVAGGSLNVFRERRSALLKDVAEWFADPRVAAYVHTELGRACVVAGDVDDAREHLRAAIALARQHSIADVLPRAEDVLTALEQNSIRELVSVPGTGPTAEAARRVAEQVEALPELSVIPSVAGT